MTVLEGTAVVREGDPITVQTLEELEALGLTRPRASFARTAGFAVISIIVSLLLVAFDVRVQLVGKEVAERALQLVDEVSKLLREQYKLG